LTPVGASCLGACDFATFSLEFPTKSALLFSKAILLSLTRVVDCPLVLTEGVLFDLTGVSDSLLLVNLGQASFVTEQLGQYVECFASWCARAPGQNVALALNFFFAWVYVLH
jgi:hypothetical protein